MSIRKVLILLQQCLIRFLSFDLKMKKHSNCLSQYGILISPDGSGTYLRNLTGTLFNLITIDFRSSLQYLIFYDDYEYQLVESDLIDYLPFYDIHVYAQSFVWEFFLDSYVLMNDNLVVFFFSDDE